MPEEIAIIMPDEQTAIVELRSLRKKAERSGKEIGEALLRWQASLGKGKFKQAFMAAGWAESSVYYYIKQAQQPEATPTLEPRTIDSVETDESGEVQRDFADPEEVEDSDEDEADDMPDNPMAKRRIEAGRRLTDLGYGPVVVQASEVHSNCEVIFGNMTLLEIENLIEALGGSND